MSEIICGDCVEAMGRMESGSVDLVLTDPPYIARYLDRSKRAVANDDGSSWLRPAFMEIARLMRPDSFCVSFYGWPKADLFMAAWRAAGLRPSAHLVFIKKYASSRRVVEYRHEQAYLLAKGNPKPASVIPDVIEWRYTGNRFHPTQKPLSAMRPLIRAFSQPGGLVLDPFAGSGTTLVAAAQLGRRAIGIELDPAHCETARSRLARLSDTRAA
jgi:site-specific DNA-methyltransferase (adenine-specific)